MYVCIVFLLVIVSEKSNNESRVCMRSRTTADEEGRERTMKRVLMTHSGFVHIVLVAPAVIAERM